MSLELARCLTIAQTAHEGQLDKGGKPYILHCGRVMNAVKRYGEEWLMAAILHDVVEDTPWTLDDLTKEGVPAAVLEAVDAISRRDDEQYFDYIRRVKENEIARDVKIADLRDNLSPSRLDVLPIETIRSLSKRYNKALDILED